MSKIFKKIGKVFKKVVKVVKKVALPALMIGAVVLTGGAALGALPAIGSVLGSIGISGTLASVLGGAISMGAMGAVTGGLTGVLSGQGFMKGATTGFLGGAALGGIGGGVGLLGANGIFGGASAAAGAAGSGIDVLSTGTLVPGSAEVIAGMGGTVAGAAPAAVASGLAAAAPSATAAAGSGGLLQSALPQILQVGGQMLSGFASGKAQADAAEEAERLRLMEDRQRYDQISYNYGYKNIYDSNNGQFDTVPQSQEAWYQYQPLDLSGPDNGLLNQAFTKPPSGHYQIVNGEVVFVGGQ